MKSFCTPFFVLFAALAGLEPLDADMAPQPETTVVATGSDNIWNLEWQSLIGRTYFIQYSEDLQNWEYLPDIVPGDGSAVSYGIAFTGEKFFVRLRYTDEETENAFDDDFDLDGWSNIDELELFHTDPFNIMTDGVTPDSQRVRPYSPPSPYPSPTDATAPEPVAQLQTRRITLERYDFIGESTTTKYLYLHPEDTPLESEPVENVSGDSSYASAKGAANFDGFCSAVEALTFGGADDGWKDGVHAFWTEAYDPSEETNYRYFRASRQQYRITLPAAATRDYKMKVRVARLNAETNAGLPVGSPPWVDLELTIPKGQTKSDAVDLAMIHTMPDEGIVYIPADIEAHGVALATDVNGLAVPAGTSFVLDFDGAAGDSSLLYLYPYANVTPPATVKWQGRRIKRDGTFEAWATLGDGTAESQETLSIAEKGCYQIRLLMTLPDNSTIEFPYTRKQDAHGIVDSQGHIATSLRAGNPDYIGIAESARAIQIRDLAVTWLGSTQYSTATQVKINPNQLGPFPGNPIVRGSAKCNIFVTHVANQIQNSYVGFYTRSRGFGLLWAAPLAREDWFTDPPEHMVMPNWPMAAATAFPAPGMAPATDKGGLRAGSGHVGIYDYDGSWINAGTNTVNKYIVPGDSGYAPVQIRDNH